MYIMQLLLFLSLVFTLPMNARISTDREKIKQVTVGNFALSGSQQPGPLVGFGQNILDKGELQAYTLIQYLNGVDKSFTSITPSLLYAPADSYSLFLRLRGVFHALFNNETFNRIENVVVQGEYAVIENNTRTTVTMITIVANLTIPIQSFIPHAHLRSSGLFLGLTANHITTNWYVFAASGATLPVFPNTQSSVTQLLYQGGISRNISFAPNGWIFNWMLELDGTYTHDKKTCTNEARHFGGNSIVLTPSLWFSTRKLILQAGASWVAAQSQSHGNTKDNYYIYGNIGWNF